MKTAIAVVATVALAAVGLAISSSPASATVFPAPLPPTAVSQQAGTLTSVDFEAAFGSIYPFADSQTIEVNYHGVHDTAAATPAAGSLLASFCGNRVLAPTVPVSRPLLGSDVNSLQGVLAHCTDPQAVSPMFSATSDGAGNIQVTGTFNLAGLPTDNVCVASQALPCLLIVSDLAQTVTFALPVINNRAASVVGPYAKAPIVGTGQCNPQSAPPTSCGVTRVTDPLVPASFYPVVFGGGAYPGIGGAAFPTSVIAQVSATLCNIDATGCGTLFGSFAPTVANPLGTLGQVVGSTDGQASMNGAFLFESGAPAIPGDYLMKITTAYLNGSFAPVGAVVQYASLRILASPHASLSVASGPVNTQTAVQGGGFEPFEPVSMNLTDINSAVFPLGASPQTTSTNGLGDIPSGDDDAAVLFTPNYPAAGVRATVGPSASVFNLPFDSAAAISYCDAGVDGDTCAVGIILDITVDPGTLQMLVTDAPSGDDFHSADDTGADIGDTTTTLNNLDLSTILLNDPDTWYPVSEATPMPVIAVGDFRGANTGWVVTANSSDLIGATQPGNVIPAADVWPSNAQCEESQIAGTGLLLTNDIPVAYGVATPGDFADDPAPDVISPLSVDSDDGAYTVCTLDTDTNALAGGIWDMDFDVVVAGRPITPVDEYAGLITVTVTSQ